MGGQPFSDILCVLCIKPVDLCFDLRTDENGKAVHAECYVIRNSPKRRGEAPGFRRTTVVVLALEHLLSAGSTFRDGFQDPVVLRERAAARGAPLVSVFPHPSGFDSEQRVEQVVSVSA